MHRGAIVGLALGAAAVALIMVPTPASAQSVGEHIAEYDVAMTLAHDGTLAVTERIAYDFGAVARHGIFRDLVESETYDAHHDRVYRISAVTVAVDNRPTPVQTSHTGHYLHLRIGDPNVTITGVHTYTIAYTPAGRGPDVRRSPGAVLGRDREPVVGAHRPRPGRRERARRDHRRRLLQRRAGKLAAVRCRGESGHGGDVHREPARARAKG